MCGNLRSQSRRTLFPGRLITGLPAAACRWVTSEMCRVTLRWCVCQVSVCSVCFLLFEAERLKGTRGQAGGWGGLFVEWLKSTSSFVGMIETRLFKSGVFPTKHFPGPNDSKFAHTLFKSQALTVNPLLFYKQISLVNKTGSQRSANICY